MHAQKFQIRYSPVQDRVLIIVTGENAHERVFGLTRRLVKRLVPGLRAIMGDETFAGLTPTMPFDPPTPSTGQDQTERSGGTAQASGGQAETPDGAPQTDGGPAGTTADGTAQPDTTPAAPQPDTHLVTRLRIVEKPKGTHVLQISDAATTLNVPLNKDQIIQFTQGILTVLGRSEWALDWNEELGAPQTVPATETASPDADSSAIDITADSPSRYRH